MRILCAALLVLGLGICVGCKKRSGSSGSDENKSGSVSGTGKSGPFTIGKSTTYVTGPKDATGHIDYAAALNERLSQGVTSEKNACVAIWKILGPSPAGGGKAAPGFFEKLGIQPLPANGEYFVGLRRYSERTGGNANSAFDSLAKFASQPWTTNENPTVAGWLKTNEKSLNALRDAVKLSHFYSPIIPETSDKGSKGMISALLPGAQSCRELAGALAARAMLFIGHNQPTEAWEDLLACHRLGRLVGRGPTLIEGLVGFAIEQIACQGDIAFLDRTKPDGNTIVACLKDLRSLPSIPDVAEKIDLSERFMFLDHIMQFDRQGMSYLTNMGGGQRAHAGLDEGALANIDWNPALENINKTFDRMANIAKEKDRATRTQKWTQFESEIRAMKARLDGGAGGTALKNTKTPTERGEIMGDIFLALMLPAAGKVMDAADRTFQTHENVIVAFAIAWYQQFNGRYPEKLADLAPTYLTQVPNDIFTGKALIYQPNATGFVLYSVGVNGRDDGGRGYSDQPAGDDLVVRIPVPLKP